jgi:hypothetical protein
MVHPRRRAFPLTSARQSCVVIDAEHFQPGRVLLGSVPEKVYALNVSLLPIALGEIDQTRALRAKEIHPKAQSFCLGIFVHC